jgi:hypothetical protein
MCTAGGWYSKPRLARQVAKLMAKRGPPAMLGARDTLTRTTIDTLTGNAPYKSIVAWQAVHTS